MITHSQYVGIRGRLRLAFEPLSGGGCAVCVGDDETVDTNLTPLSLLPLDDSPDNTARIERAVAAFNAEMSRDALDVIEALGGRDPCEPERAEPREVAAHA